MWLNPFLPNGFADHYPVFKWLFHWEYTLFSDKPKTLRLRQDWARNPNDNNDVRWQAIMGQNWKSYKPVSLPVRSSVQKENLMS